MTYTAPYTLTDYTTIIRRELSKRQSAYPKIMAKRIREGYNGQAQINLATEQRLQYELLQDAEKYLVLINPSDPNHAAAIWRELRRELRMRKRCYPRWVAFRRMEAADAERELHAWTSLCDDFHREFCPEAKIRGPRMKRNPI